MCVGRRTAPKKLISKAYLNHNVAFRDLAHVKADRGDHIFRKRTRLEESRGFDWRTLTDGNPSVKSFFEPGMLRCGFQPPQPPDASDLHLAPHHLFALFEWPRIPVCPTCTTPPIHAQSLVFCAALGLQATISMGEFHGNRWSYWPCSFKASLPAHPDFHVKVTLACRAFLLHPYSSQTYANDVDKSSFARVLEADQRQLHLLLPEETLYPLCIVNGKKRTRRKKE